MGAVLVVEDEAVVLEATIALLRALGHVAHPARSGDDAMKALIKHPGIDVILADVTLGDGVDDVLAFENLAEDAVLAVQPGRLEVRDEELRAVCVRARVRHRQHARSVVLARQRADAVAALVAVNCF